MTRTERLGWQDVRAAVIERIERRDWRPGEPIPNEADLAAEFGCARTTVNRALRSLSDEGVLDRRRKSGTRVAAHPVRRAVLSIPLIRREIEASGRIASHRLLLRAEATPPPVIATAFGDAPRPLLHVVALHLADGAPFVLEDRWIDPVAVPEALQADFDAVSANEWLVLHTPLTEGEIAMGAEAATDAEVGLLATAPGAPLVVLTRRTWRGPMAITEVRLAYAPGYRLVSRF